MSIEQKLIWQKTIKIKDEFLLHEKEIFIIDSFLFVCWIQKLIDDLEFTNFGFFYINFSSAICLHFVLLFLKNFSSSFFSSIVLSSRTRLFQTFLFFFKSLIYHRYSRILLKKNAKKFTTENFAQAVAISKLRFQLTFSSQNVFN